MDLIAPEHPGYGETEMPDWLAGFDDLVLHYDELLDVLGLDTVHVVGYSLGGWIAAELAAFYPRRLRSLTLICPAGLRVPGQPAPNLIAMTTEAVWETLFNDPRNIEQVMPDYDSVDEVVHLYGEATTFARLVWNPQYDLALERRLRRVELPRARGPRRVRPGRPRRGGRALRRPARRAHRAGRRAPGTRSPSSSPSGSPR